MNREGPSSSDGAESTQGSSTISTWAFWHCLALLLFAKSSKYSTRYDPVPPEANRPFPFFCREMLQLS